MFFYFNHTLVENFRAYVLTFNELSFMKLEFKLSEIVVYLIDMLLFVAAMMVIRSGETDNSVSTRKKVWVTLLLFIASIIMLFLQKPLLSNGLIFLVIAVVVSIALCYIKKSKLVDILMVVMMIAIIVNQYLPLFGIVI